MFIIRIFLGIYEISNCFSALYVGPDPNRGNLFTLPPLPWTTLWTTFLIHRGARE